jgi:hypothetical protein
MTSTSTAERGIQDEILETVRKSQDVVIEALQKWTAGVQSVTSSFPKLNLPYADKLPKWNLPYAELPKPEELVSNAYDFAGQLLAAQRKFAKDVLQVTAPLSGRGDEA